VKQKRAQAKKRPSRSSKPKSGKKEKKANGQIERETLGARIRRLRITHASSPMTLRGLAAAAQISAPFLSDIEHDRRRPGDAVMSALAKSLGAPLRDLESRTLNRDTLRALNGDPELVAMIRKVMSDARYRVLVLRATSGVLHAPKNGGGA
jgi:transcriptional regulator with XRE-family HTH domain